MSMKIKRPDYAAQYGPTTGDKVYLAEILERAREGCIPMLTDMMEYGATIIKKADVMEGVADMLTVVQVEAVFPDGTKLVTVMNPVRE